MVNSERRLIVEEVGNGWLVKVTESGNDKIASRSVFINLGDLMEFLEKELEKGATS